MGVSGTSGYFPQCNGSTKPSKALCLLLKDVFIPGFLLLLYPIFASSSSDLKKVLGVLLPATSQITEIK